MCPGGEMADAQRSERCGRKVMGVRLSPWAPVNTSILISLPLILMNESDKPFLAENERHPLEGRHIIFKYTEWDRENEGSAFELYKLIGGELKNVLAPWVFDPTCLSIFDMDKKAVEFMVQAGITEVTTVFFIGTFFGLQSGGAHFDREPVEDDDCLRVHGITMHFFDATQGRFLTEE
jgi:hypothetical protein